MTGPLPVTDPDDPRVAAFRDIRERDLIGRRGLFIAEGEVVLKVLLGPASRFAPAAILVAEARVPRLASLLATVPAGIPLLSASQAVMDRIAGFPIHRGILALGRCGKLPDAAELIASAGPDAVVVATCGIANHDNLGGIFRNAAAFGARAVILDPGCCDPLYRKAIRVSVGAALVQPYARTATGEDLWHLLESRGFQLLGLSPRGRCTLSDVAAGGRKALILGTEGPGLPAAVLDRVTTVRIPMAGPTDSLNVATASGIALHHLLART